MNKDYTYCVGFGYFDQPELCKNCRRNIPYGKPVPDEVLWWTSVQYDPKTGKCPLHEPKTMSDKTELPASRQE